MLPERTRTRPGRVPTLPGLILEGVWSLLGPRRRLLDISWALLNASWAPLGRLLGPSGLVLGTFCISWLSRTSPTSILGASGLNFEGPGAAILSI